MSLSRIRTNLQAQLALQNLQRTNNAVSDIQEKLQTGKRINKAADDSAGYSIAAKLRARVGGQAQALRNVGDAQSIIGVAEGGLNTIQDMLQQMKEKIVQGANDSNGAEERKAIRTELKALTEEIQQTLDETTFNGNNLFTDDIDGTDFTFQVNAEKGDTFELNIERLSSDSMSLTDDAGVTGKIVGAAKELTDLVDADVAGNSVMVEGEFDITVTALSAIAGTSDVAVTFSISGSGSTIGGDFNGAGLTTKITVGAGAGTLDFDALFGVGGTAEVALQGLEDDFTVGDKFFVAYDDMNLNVRNNDVAGDSLKVIDDAISAISGAVSNLGDAQNRLSFKAENLNTAMINNEAARSQIEDADFAYQQVQLAKMQILQQTNVSALAQANAAPQSVLSLIG